MEILLIVCVTFIVTCGLGALLALVPFYRVATHVRGNPAATAAVIDNVILPILGRCPPKPIVPTGERA